MQAVVLRYAYHIHPRLQFLQTLPENTPNCISSKVHIKNSVTLL